MATIRILEPTHAPDLTVIEGRKTIPVHRCKFNVEIGCMGCKQDIFYMLNQLPGVLTVDVNFHNQTVELIYREPATEGQFRRALHRAHHNIKPE